MSEIVDYELKIRRVKLMMQYQQYQASVNNAQSGNFGERSQHSSQNIGRMDGRSFSPIENANSKESKLYQIYLLSAIEDQLRPNYVNTVKKAESHTNRK